MKNTIFDSLDDFRQNYASEIVSQIDSIESIVLQLENETNPPLAKELNRKLMAGIHSIKGNAAALNFESVKIICHKIEDLMISEIDTSIKIKTEVILKFLDSIKDYFYLFTKNGTIDEHDFTLKHVDIFSNAELINQKKIINDYKKIHLNILIIGIPMSIINNVKRVLPNLDFQVSFAHNSINALERIAREKFDIIISSYFLEPINGLTLSLTIKSEWPNLESKYILLPSQKINLSNHNSNLKLLPDIIIEKNESLISELSTYIKKNFLNYREIKKILCFDDEENILEIYKMIFSESYNVEVKYILSESEYIKQLEEYKPDLVLSDVHLNHFNVGGILKKYSSQTSFIFITGDPESQQSKKLTKDGALAIWDKSVIATDLIPKLAELGIELYTNDQ
jgi:PleD family two-component response regulator